MSTLIVVDDPDDWPANGSGLSVVPARSYLADAAYGEDRAARVVNLCRSYTYQSLGYYVSLLAQARGHRPVPGIVTPRSADPCFALPQALVRAALAEYREQTGFADWISTHDAGPAAPWRAMSPAGREAAVRTVLDTFVAAHGGRPGAVELVAVEIDVRLVLRLDDALLAPLRVAVAGCSGSQIHTKRKRLTTKLSAAFIL